MQDLTGRFGLVIWPSLAAGGMGVLLRRGESLKCIESVEKNGMRRVVAIARFRG